MDASIVSAIAVIMLILMPTDIAMSDENCANNDVYIGNDKAEDSLMSFLRSSRRGEKQTGKPEVAHYTKQIGSDLESATRSKDSCCSGCRPFPWSKRQNMCEPLKK